jgi:hypothetical protein
MKNKTMLQTVKFCYIMVAMFAVLFVFKTSVTRAQTLYVDAQKGKNNATGTIKDPILTLDEAVLKTNGFKSNEPVTLKLNPGLYTVTHKLTLKTAGPANSTTPYTIEAVIMPDVKAWQPASMPVILSISGNNDTYEFAHCDGFFVSRNNVNVKGLKFMGNPNTSVHYYYPIRRQDKALSGLNVSQCYFIGEANSSALQSSFWASGAGIHVDHCIFYNSKIAFVLGDNVNDFSLTHTIIDGAYNTAIWYGFAKTTAKFTFKNNVITNCYYVMVYPVEDGQPSYTFSDSYITNNANYLGNYPKPQDKFFAEANKHIKEVNIVKKGTIKLVSVADDGMTRENLNLSTASAGISTGAGIFSK